MVMRLVNGRSLEAHVRSHGPLELKDVIRIAQQIASGLAAAHRQGLIHRDIKPANILLEQDVSRVMITDFGLARAADDAAITQTGWLAGTPHYMSPEQARGTQIDQRSDLFSLGSLIYFMTTGREPFRAEKPFAVIQKIINEVPVRVRELNADASKTLAQIIERLLEKNPKDRFQSAEEVQQKLEQYLAHLQNPLASPKPRRIRARKIRVRFLVGLATMVAVSAMMFALSQWRLSTGPIQDVGQSEIWNRQLEDQQEQETLSANAPVATIGSAQSEPPEPQPDYWSEDDLNLELQAIESKIRELESILAVEKIPDSFPVNH